MENKYNHSNFWATLDLVEKYKPLITAIAFIAPIIVLTHLLIPMTEDTSIAKGKIEGGEIYKRFLYLQLETSDDPVRRKVLINRSPLSANIVTFNYTNTSLPDTIIEKHLRAGNLIIYIGGTSIFWIVTIITLKSIKLVRHLNNFGSSKVELKNKTEDKPKEKSEDTAEDTLISIAEESRFRSLIFYFSSLIFLLCGVFMAFIGVAIFYVTLPHPFSSGESNYDRHIIFTALKSTTALLSIEAVAWFLLKQHRLLARDYKQLYFLSIKQDSNLAAYRILQRDDAKEKELLLATSLLTEHHSSSTAISSDSDDHNDLASPSNPLYLILTRLIEKIDNN